MANKKIQATATLFLDTKDAQSDAKKFVNDLKQKLSEVETAADKMTVFKDMVAYIAQVDRALAALRKNNKDAFNSMFDGLDSNLKQQLEGLFGVNGAQLGQVEVLREKLNTLTLKSSIKEIRTFAKEINALFTSIGVSAPFDNIDEQFSGRTNTGHIQALATSLANFATVWEDLSARVSQGFGGAGGSGSGVFGGLNKEVQEEIDKLKKQKEEYQQVIDAINKKPIKINITAENDAEELEKLINAYREIQKKTTSSDFTNLSFEEQNKLLAERVRLATLLKNTSDHIIDNDGSNEAFDMATSGDGMRAIESAETFLDNFYNDSKEKAEELRKLYIGLVSDIDSQLRTLQGPSTSHDIKDTVSLYGKLNEKIREYFELKKQLNNIEEGSVEYNNIQDRQRAIQSEILTLKQLSEAQEDSLYGIFDDIDEADVPFKNALTNICNTLEVEIPQATNQAGEQIDTFGKKIVNVSEYVSALSGQLKEMFAAAGRSANFEYHIAIDGLDIKARHGSEKSVDLATQTETYLDTLFSDPVLYGHSHRGGTSATNIYDIETVLSSYRDGVSIPVHFVVGKDSITTMDFTGLSKDMANQLMQEIAATNSNKNAPVINESINKIVEKFTGNSGALKTWNVEQFDDLAKYIYDVSSAASSALTPIEKFQAVLDNMFGKGKVDATKYESLLSGLDKNNVKNIFNQIASIENLQPIKTTDMLTMGQVNAEIDESIAKYKTLREEANLSYADIRNEVDKVIEHYNAGGSATSGLDFFQKYFPEGEWQNVRNLLTDAYDNLISIEEVTNRIAGEFGVDPDTFAQIPNGVQTSQIVDETNQKLREQEQLWENVKIAIKNGIGEVVGIDDMATALEVIEGEIKEGILTSLEECIARFREFNNISEEGSLEFVGKRERVIEDRYDTYLSGEDEVVSKEEADKLRQLSVQQEQLYQNLRSAIKGTLSDIVDVDDMTYAFDTIEKEIEAGLLATLDQCIERFKLLIGLDDKRLTSIKDDQRVADSWDYYQGNRYVDDGETVIDSSEYNQLREDLADEQDRANQYAGDAAVAEDRADKAEARAAEAEARVLEVESDALRYQEAADRLLEEKSVLQRENDELREQLSIQTDADHKSQLAQAEIAQLELLQQKLLEVKTAVDAKTQAFEDERVTVDGVVDAEITSLQSLITQLHEVVAQINLINDGFNNINTNAPKVELKSAQVDQSVATTENPYYLTDSRGNRKLMYRGVHGAISGLVSNRYHGGTFFTDIISLAKQYAGMNGKVESANISMKNPLEIDAHGHQWNDLLYIGNGADEASKKIHQLRLDIKDLEMQLNNVFDEYGAIDDIDLHSKLTEDLDAKRSELKSIYDDPLNPYGKYDTNGLVEYAKSAGYDGVVFRNIKDGTNEISNIVVTLQENQIHFVETLKTNFESLLTDFIGYFGKIEDFLSHYKQFKNDYSLFPEIEDEGRAFFGEQLDKYEELKMLGEPEIINEFLNKNKILGAYDKRVPGGLDSLLSMPDVEERIDAIVSFYLNAIYELEKIQEAFNTKATSVEQYQREQSGNLTSYDKISTVKSGYNDKALNDRESYKYADATIEDLDAKKDQAIAAANAFKELFANLDIETANPDQLKKVVDSFVSAIKLIDDAQNMATGIVENSIGAPDTNAMRDFHELGPIRDSLTADYLDILQAEAKQIEQIEIDALNAQEQRLKSEQESANIVGQKTQVDAVPDANVQEEIGQLNQLKVTLDEVKNAVLAKTKAFIDEGNIVGQVVGKEVAALMKLATTVDSIVPKVDSLVSGLKGLREHGADIKITGSDDAGKTSSSGSDASPVDPFKAKLSAQKGAFSKYRNDVKDADYLTEDLKKQIDSLGISLQEVTDPAGLDNWLKRFANLKADIQAVRSEFEQMNLGSINLFQRELTNSFNKLTLPQKEDMLKEYLQAIVLLNRQKQAVEEGHAVEVAAIKEITAELQKKINAQIEANKVAKDAEKVQKKNGNFGSTASINATAKYNSLIEKASSTQFANSSTIAAALMDYEEAYRRMIKTRDELRSKDFVDDSDKEEFKRLTTECNKASSALEKLIKNTMKLKGEAVNENPYLLGSDFKDDKDGRVSELTNFVQGIKGADLATLQFKDNWNEVVFAVDNGDGTFTQMTATFTDARNEIVALAGDTKKVQGKFESFIDGVKNRLQSLSQYFIATVGIYDVWNVIKQGINHVREIDLALTELRKVTNQTEQDYKRFLQTMSQTASATGSTVKDLTSSAADWARLNI